MAKLENFRNRRNITRQSFIHYNLDDGLDPRKRFNARGGTYLDRSIEGFVEDRRHILHPFFAPSRIAGLPWLELLSDGWSAIADRIIFLGRYSFCESNRLVRSYSSSRFMIGSGRFSRGRYGFSFSLPLLCDVFETCACRIQASGFARVHLPALNNHIDIVRVDFEGAGAPAGFFRRDNCGAASGKRIKHKIRPARGIPNDISDERNRLYGRVHRELIEASSPEGVYAGIVPDIGPVAAMPAKFDVVDVRSITDLEDRDEFVLGPVKRSHAAIVLVPYAKVEDAVIDFPSC